MPKYHNSVHGPRPCKATIQECPIGGEHFDNVQDAEKSYQKTLSEKFGEFTPLVARKSNSEKIRQSSYLIADALANKINTFKANDKVKKKVSDLQQIKRALNDKKEALKDAVYEADANLYEWTAKKKQAMIKEAKQLREDIYEADANFYDWTKKKEKEFKKKIHAVKINATEAVNTLDQELRKAENFVKTAKAEIKRDVPIYYKSMKHYAKLNFLTEEDRQDLKNMKETLGNYGRKAKKIAMTKQVGASSLKKYDTYNGFTVLNVTRRRGVVGLTCETPDGNVETVKIPADTKIRVKRSPSRVLRNSVLPAARQVLKTPLRNRVIKPSAKTTKEYAAYVGAKDAFTRNTSENAQFVAEQVNKLSQTKQQFKEKSNNSSKNSVLSGTIV